MIANAGAMGLDWRYLSLSAYFEALEAFKEAHDPKAGGANAEVSDELKRFMKAHTVQ